MQRTPVTLAGLVPRTRPLPRRKQVLFEHHEHLLAHNDLVLFLRPGDFSAHEWRQLRSDLTRASTPESKLALTLLRPGLLPALLRAAPASLDHAHTHLADPSHLTGPLAVLTAPSLSPATLKRVLNLVAQFSKTQNADAPPAAANTPAPERLRVLSSLLERRTAADATRTAHVATLPELDHLRSQLVGLVQAPASRIVGVVSQRAREVSRTVEGFKEGLAADSKPSTP